MNEICYANNANICFAQTAFNAFINLFLCCLMKEISLIISALCCLGLFTQCEDPDQVAFLSRWSPTNQGAQPYGNLYPQDQLPDCPRGYHIPTEAEFDQLITYPSVWVTDGPNGVGGYWFCPTEAAKASPSIAAGCAFFPAAGFREVYEDGGIRLVGQGTQGLYWSSTYNESAPDDVYCLYFIDDGVAVDWLPSSGTDSGQQWKNALSVRCIK